MTRTPRVVLGLLTVGVAAVALTSLSVRYSPVAEVGATSELGGEATGPRIEVIPSALSIRRGDTLEDLLDRGGVDRSSKFAIIEAVREAFDVKKFRAGSVISLTRSRGGELDSVQYIIDPDHMLQVKRAATGFEAAVVEIPGTVRVVPVCLSLHNSLYESIDEAGESPELTLLLAEIFAWDLDFYTDPREGDEFCVLVEKKAYANGQPETLRKVLAAKYYNRGELYEAFLFPDPDGKAQYYSRDGKSLQSAFLRSPLKFQARISSRFSHRRFHPVLKIHRPHLGTDYAAPTGTPVQAVASGRVIFSGRSGGAGNLVKIQHDGRFETQYMHLSRRYVKKGQRVAQGQRIGAVGATGLATGPHLDFRLRKNGKFFDFERMKPPRLSRIADSQMGAFAEMRGRFAALMNPGPQPEGMMLAGDPLVDSLEAVD